jgi:hypothetical protein
MTELEKYELINSTETFEELKSAVEKIGPIMGRGREWTVQHMIGAISVIEDTETVVSIRDFYSPAQGVHGFCVFNTLTRSYGLRQQAIYLKLYKPYI